MQPESSISVYLIASIILVVLGIMLMGFRIRVERLTFNLRLSRVFMVCAYFMLAIALFLSHVYEGSGDTKHNEITTPAVSALQSMFFTFTLLSILLPTYISRRQLLIHATIVLGVITLYLVAAFSIEKYRIIVNIGVFAYLCLLVFYTRLFLKKYALSVRQLEDYYDEDEQGRLHWVKISFFTALTIGIFASVSTYFPFWVDYWFVSFYIVFYIWFVIRFYNYVTKIDFYLAATTRQMEGVADTTQKSEQNETEICPKHDSVKKKKFKKKLEEWVLNEGYMKGDVSTEEIARLLGTNLPYLRSYFHNHMSSDFRTWRNELRIHKAKELITDHPDMSLNQIAIQVGFVTRSNFYLYFKKITGQSPADYRDRIASNRK